MSENHVILLHVVKQIWYFSKTYMRYSLEILKNHIAWHESFDQSKAFEALKGEEDFTFLLRTSSTQTESKIDCFTISYVKNRKIYHSRVNIGLSGNLNYDGKAYDDLNILLSDALLECGEPTPLFPAHQPEVIKKFAAILNEKYPLNLQTINKYLIANWEFQLVHDNKLGLVLSLTTPKEIKLSKTELSTAQTLCITHLRDLTNCNLGLWAGPQTTSIYHLSTSTYYGSWLLYVKNEKTLRTAVACIIATSPSLITPPLPSASPPRKCCRIM